MSNEEASTVPNAEVLEALPEFDGNEVVIVLRDGAEPGTVDVAVAARPEEFNPNSPAHRVGLFIGKNLEALVNMSANLHVPPAIGQRAQDAEPGIIGPDRERTILGADGVALLPGSVA